MHQPLNYVFLFAEPSISIRELDIPVNAVATALKDFFSKRLPPLIPPCLMNELTEISGKSIFDVNMSCLPKTY